MRIVHSVARNLVPRFNYLKKSHLKVVLLTSLFSNDTELLRLSHYRIRQTEALSKPPDEYTSGKLKKKSQKIFRL